MPDALAVLPPLSWRGIEVPVLSRKVSFAHESVQHKLQFRDGELVEMTGRRNWTFSYTIPFRKGVAKGGFPDLYSVRFPTFLEAVRDKAPGELIDPELGTFTAVVGEVSLDSDAKKRDGVDMAVTFIHAPTLDEIEGPDDFQAPAVASVQSDAGALDKAVVGMPYFDIPRPPLAVDPFAQIAGYGRQVAFQGSRIAGAMSGVADRCEDIETSSEAAMSQDSQHALIVRSARRLNVQSRRAAENAANPLRPIRVVTTRAAKTLSGVAAEFGTTVDDLLRLNPSLAGSPTVPAGTKVNV